MAIAGVRGTGSHPNAARRRGEADVRSERQQGQAQADIGRALVLVEQPPNSADERLSRLVDVRSDAAFVTQLIATNAGLPQTRARRRVEPAVSVAAYAESGRSTFALPAGMIVRRTA